MDLISLLLKPLIFFQNLNDPTINLILVMVLIWSTGVLFRKIKQPPVLGELLAGIIFGPALLDIIRPDQTIEVLSELGVFFLMFYAGLETNPYDLKKMGKHSFMIGVGGFIVPFVAGYLVCSIFFNVSTTHSLFVGLGLAITAISVNVRVLHDMDMFHYRVTSAIIGAAIIDDILCFALFSAIISFAATQTVDITNILVILMKVFCFFGISLYIGTYWYPKISRHFATKEAKGFTFSLIVALLFGLLAEIAGLHIIIGAYMAGLFMGENIFSKELFDKVNDRFVAITYGFLGPIFFFSSASYTAFLSAFNKHILAVESSLSIAWLCATCLPV
jgi:Kef-type K+ transport system membrane component KefB